jgi:hypothetical protein
MLSRCADYPRSTTASNKNLLLPFIYNMLQIWKNLLKDAISFLSKDYIGCRNEETDVFWSFGNHSTLKMNQGPGKACFAWIFLDQSSSIVSIFKRPLPQCIGLFKGGVDFHFTNSSFTGPDTFKNFCLKSPTHRGGFYPLTFRNFPMLGQKMLVTKNALLCEFSCALARACSKFRKSCPTLYSGASSGPWNCRWRCALAMRQVDCRPNLLVPLAWRTTSRNVINDHCEFEIGLKRTIGQGKAFLSKVTLSCTTHQLPHANWAQIASNCGVIFVISSSEREF